MKLLLMRWCKIQFSYSFSIKHSWTSNFFSPSFAQMNSWACYDGWKCSKSFQFLLCSTLSTVQKWGGEGEERCGNHLIAISLHLNLEHGRLMAMGAWMVARLLYCRKEFFNFIFLFSLACLLAWLPVIASTLLSFPHSPDRWIYGGNVVDEKVFQASPKL